MLTILTFRIKDVLFGIEIEFVREVNRNVEYTNVPGAPEKVVGLFNMRGHVVVLFNLAYLFHYKDTKVSTESACIVLKSSNGNMDNVGFIIDKTGDVLQIEDDQCEPPAANATVWDMEYIKSVIKTENELLLLIDPDKVFKI